EAAVGVRGAAVAAIAPRGTPHARARAAGARSRLRGHALGGRAVGVLLAALPPVRARCADAGAVLPRDRRIAVVAAEHDEHLVLGGDAALQRARVAHAVVGAGGAVTQPIVANAPLPALRGLKEEEARAGPAGGPALAADAETLEGRIRRRRVALHRIRIGVAVVVDGAELEPPGGGIGAVQYQ